MFAQDRITDSWLVRRTLAGRRDCFDRLVERHIRGVYAVALARTRNHADAEDVVQDAFICAFTGLDKLREPGKFSGWVTTIARNASSKLQVRRKHELDSLAAQQIPATSEAPDASQVELHALLRDQLNDLDADAREVLLMHYFAGHSAREIAARLEITRDAALKRLQRAREKLASAILGRLEGALDARHDDVKKRSVRIVRALAVLAVPWASQKAAAAFAVRPAVLLLAGSVVTGIALLSLFVWINADDPIAPSESAAPIQVAATDVFIPQPEIAEAPRVPEAAAVEPVQPDLPETEALPPTLDGLWTLHQPKDDPKWPAESLWPTVATVELTQHGNKLTMDRVSPNPEGARRSQGVIEDGHAIFPMVEIVGIMYGGNPNSKRWSSNPVAAGPANAFATRIRLDGLLPDFEKPDEVPPQPFAIVINKLRDDEANFERTLHDVTAQTQRLRDAILAYAYDHRGRLPRSLTELVPRYLDDLALVTDNEQRSLIYNPGARDLISAVRPLTDLENYRPDLSKRERLIEWETELTEYYGEEFPSPADLLRVRVGTSSIEIRAGFHGDPEILGAGRTMVGQPDAGGDTGATARALAEHSMQRVKEVGLAFAHFWQLSEEQYNPPGWRSLVPGYIEDPSLLTRPGDGLGTLNYAMLFPATSRAELTAIFAVVNGVDEGSVNPDEVGAGIPLVYENTPHMIEGREFRNVLFLDGHVGLFHERDWARYVEPYLPYAAQ